MLLVIEQVSRQQQKAWEDEPWAYIWVVVAEEGLQAEFFH